MSIIVSAPAYRNGAHIEASTDVEKGNGYYLGTLCTRKHEAYSRIDEVNIPTGKSLRDRFGNCCACVNHQRRETDALQLGKAEARRRLEDIKLAKELGISVEDLKE